MSTLDDLIKEWRSRLNRCVGYPTCDGVFPGESHNEKCPEYGRNYEPISVTKCIIQLEAYAAREREWLKKLEGLVARWQKNDDNAYRQIVYETCADELSALLKEK